MVILTQYPHYLYYTSQQECIQDDCGNWKYAEKQWNYFCRCRIERNGQAQQITTVDGKKFQFTATIYMPVNSELFILPIGTEILVSLKPLEVSEITKETISSLKAQGIILINKSNATFEKGRLHNRMWV